MLSGTRLERLWIPKVTKLEPLNKNKKQKCPKLKNLELVFGTRLGGQRWLPLCGANNQIRETQNSKTQNLLR